MIPASEIRMTPMEYDRIQAVDSGIYGTIVSTHGAPSVTVRWDDGTIGLTTYGEFRLMRKFVCEPLEQTPGRQPYNLLKGVLQ